MLRTIFCPLILTAVLGSGAQGQSIGELPTFEVASIKVSQTPAGRGLASLREDINTDPARLTMANVSLNTAIRWAYKLGVYEVSGPDWTLSERFDITAKAASP